MTVTDLDLDVINSPFKKGEVMMYVRHDGEHGTYSVFHGGDPRKMVQALLWVCDEVEDLKKVIIETAKCLDD